MDPKTKKNCKTFRIPKSFVELYINCLSLGTIGVSAVRIGETITHFARETSKKHIYLD